MIVKIFSCNELQNILIVNFTIIKTLSQILRWEYNLDLHLSNKLAVVTGAARGIGHAISRSFLAEGAVVLMADRDEQVIKVAKNLGAESLVCDLGSAESADLVAARSGELGGCAVLVNNAGISIMGDAASTSDRDWQDVMAVNLDAAFRLSRELWSQLADKSGAIVNIASFAAKRATLFGNNVSYTVSKHGIAGLTRATAMDGAKVGIRVNGVAPGVVDTDLVKLHDENTRARIQTMIPLNRYAQPNEIADVVVFLSSSRASHITGEIVNINGGLVMD